VDQRHEQIKAITSCITCSRFCKPPQELAVNERRFPIIKPSHLSSSSLIHRGSRPGRFFAEFLKLLKAMAILSVEEMMQPAAVSRLRLRWVGFGPCTQ